MPTPKLRVLRTARLRLLALGASAIREANEILGARLAQIHGQLSTEQASSKCPRETFPRAGRQRRPPGIRERRRRREPRPGARHAWRVEDLTQFLRRPG